MCHLSCWLALLVVSGIIAGSFTPVNLHGSDGPPTVVATKPVNGAVNVSRSLQTVEFTFSEPMKTGSCGGASSNWTGGTCCCVWSADQKTLTMGRGAPDQPLPMGARVTLVLNPPGLPAVWYRDLDGNPLESYTLTFTVETALDKVEPTTDDGFDWPYFLYVPSRLKQPTVLLVEPNNSGNVSDNNAWHEDMARQIMVNHSVFADRLGAPLLVPTFPRPASHSHVYTHALDRNTLLTTLPGLHRIDLQLLAMIDDARTRLAAQGVATDPRVWMLGFSASASFTGRFTVLHPRRIRAASIGAGGYGPIVPVPEWRGRTLEYPVGTADVESLTGTGFDAAGFAQVGLQIYVGDQDTNIVPWFRPESDPEAALLESLFGGPECFRRWPGYELVYQSATDLAQFVVFPGLGHNWPNLDYITDFFDRHRQDPPPPPLAKPVEYVTYFPHVATIAPWETEIALFNTKDGATIRGRLEAYDASGRLLRSIDLDLPGLVRSEVRVDNTFDDPDAVAYLVYRSDSGFVNGYTRFYEPLNRVAITADRPARYGWIPKNEGAGGWTGIALVNTEAAPVTVELRALDLTGTAIRTVQLELRPGEKLVKLAHEIFGDVLAQVAHFSFKGSGEVIGFSVNGSSDGQRMDGMAVIREEYLGTGSTRIP